MTVPPAAWNRRRLSTAARISGVSRPYEWMSSVDTIRSRAAAVSITSSDSRVHGVCASSSKPAPSARST